MVITAIARTRIANGTESNDLKDVTHACVRCGTMLTRTVRPVSGDADVSRAGADFRTSLPRSAYEFRLGRSYTTNHGELLNTATMRGQIARFCASARWR
jgi:hypothetical protein